MAEQEAHGKIADLELMIDNLYEVQLNLGNLDANP